MQNQSLAIVPRQFCAIGAHSFVQQGLILLCRSMVEKQPQPVLLWRERSCMAFIGCTRKYNSFLQLNLLIIGLKLRKIYEAHSFLLSIKSAVPKFLFSFYLATMSCVKSSQSMMLCDDDRTDLFRPGKLHLPSRTGVCKNEKIQIPDQGVILVRIVHQYLLLSHTIFHV